METAADYVVLVMLLAAVGGMIYFVVRQFKPSAPPADAPVPLGFHERKRMELQEFYETYYLKPGSEIRMSHVQQGLGMFSLEARVPMELLRPTDRLSDFGQRGRNIFSSILAVQLQQQIAGNPKLADSKLETVDDLIQLAIKAEAEPGA